MAKWTEVVDPVEIGRLNAQLKRELTRRTQPGGWHVIGYPAGKFDARVRMAPVVAGQDLWMYIGNHEETDDFITLIGRHIQDQRGSLLIDLQFNFPKGRFSRQKGGAFVKDSDGNAYLAHRGIVTRGTSRVRKDEIFRHLGDKRIVAASTEGPNEVELLLVVALDDERIASKILRFAGRVRDAATLAASAQPTPPTQRSGTGKAKGGALPKSRLDLILSEYRDEFAGTRVIHRKGPVTVEWKHGDVVKALRNKLREHGEALKCQAADLVVKHGQRIDLFEVKRSSGSQSIYTAIGQLVFNGYSLEKEFQAHTVRRFLVLPGSQRHRARQDRCKDLGFKLVTFTLTGRGYRFDGLPDERTPSDRPPGS